MDNLPEKEIFIPEDGNSGDNLNLKTKRKQTMYRLKKKEALPGATFEGFIVTHTPKVQEHVTYKMSKARILKNIAVISFGFLFLFTSFFSLVNLQSSLNKEEGLGTGGLSIIYGALIVSCMLLPPFIIGRVGCKWTIFFSMLCYILYMGANFYAIWGTIVPSAIILGLGAAPLWSAKCTYLTSTGVWYAEQTGTMIDDVINRFFGFFFMVFQTSQIWGNLISSVVFKTTSNTTYSDENLQKCGASFCPDSDVNNTNLDKPPIDKVYTLCGICVGIAVLAVIIIAVGVDPIVLDKEDSAEDKQFSVKLMMSTLKHLWKSHYQKLLVPLTMYSGIEQAFITGDFTKSYVSCALGIENIGFIMICYGVVDAVCSFTFGRLVQFVGHIPFFVLAFLIHGGCQIAFLLWRPDPDALYLFYVLAALWGMGDAVIQTQINALYGFLWTKDSEAAFANYRLWESLGFIIVFACQNLLCTNIKLYMCLGFLCVGMLNYAIVEVMFRRHGAESPMRDIKM